MKLNHIPDVSEFENGSNLMTTERHNCCVDSVADIVINPGHCCKQPNKGLILPVGVNVNTEHMSIKIELHLNLNKYLRLDY